MTTQKTLKKYYTFIILSAIIAFLGLTNTAEAKSVYGYIELVVLYPDKIPLNAKLDTGAVTASLSAKDIYLYKKGDKDYVKFKVSHPDIQQSLDYDLPVLRITKIKKRAGEGISKNKYASRPVVKMPISFDGELHNITVNLVDRSHFSTPMLLGRKTLEKLNAVVDSTVKYTI